MATLLTLHHLLLHEIEDLYSAEEQIIDALPAMIDKATDRELKKALNDHLRVTKEQKDRLEAVKELLQTEEQSEEQKGFFERVFGSSKKCKGTEGLIKEGEKLMSEDMDPKVMDAAIIAAAQKIEHYEISGYGTARAYAAELGLKEVAELLSLTLNEEYYADDSLTTLAMSKVNIEAEGPRSRRQPGPVKKAAAKKQATKAPAKNAAGKNKVVKKNAAKKSAPKKAAKKKSARQRSRR